MSDRLTSKRTVFLLVLAAASVALVSASRPWVSGTVEDVVLGSSAVHGRGSDIAPGVAAAALVGLASVVVAATSGRVLRLVALWATVLAAALGVAVIVSVLVDPAAALGKLASTGTGRSGAQAAQGQIGGWLWAALVAMVVMGLAGVAALIGGSRWTGLSSTYDAGEGSPPTTRRRATTKEPRSAWDQISRGDDPTL